MYFVNLMSIKSFDKDLLKSLDSLLVNFHSSAELFTPIRVGKNLNIPKDLSYQLLLSAREVGVVDTVFVRKCSNCGKLIKFNGSNAVCPVCRSTNFKEGYYFTTDLYKREMMYQ
ncbi:hypothetical protein SAMN04488072_10425 [Lentibacillus halodurans]|uniref:Uncharacterized protein n=1 Tax=Lentibacillus halodurans TaxID=237679 RepID=A0A1I0X190_9BACI|nr:hypothetical protein SAMN04488072_10425 [Lentibacillus halodurans]